MKFFSIGNHLTPYLLAASVGLAGVLAVESRNMVEPDGEVATKEKPAVNTVERTTYRAPALATFSEITERPLFSEGREPPAEPVQAAVTAKQSPLRLHLEGVAISPEAKIAVVRDLSNNKILHLAAGTKHQGWELTSVTETVATFTRGEQNVQLQLIDKNKKTRR